MRRIYKQTLTVLLAGFSSFSLFAQNNFFSRIDEKDIVIGKGTRTIIPQRFNLAEANLTNLKSYLWSLPDEAEVTNRALAPIMELPMPNGTVAKFRVWESSIQEPGLEAKFPDIKTFAGQGIDDPYATIRMDYGPAFGFHAQILSPSGRIYIDPYARGNINYYMSYFQADYTRSVNFQCLTEAGEIPLPEGTTANKLLAGPCRGTQLYTYRLAVACTGEYAVAVGAAGNATALHNAIVTSVNRVTGVYENDLAVRLILVANNNLVEFLSAATDPFNGNNNAGTLIAESQTVITNNIGSANYDIGHTFSTGGGGLAGLGVVCNTSNKARGITGSPQPYGDAYDIDYVAHEIGHQFGGNHTFNSVSSSCNGNRTASTAYEVGSGTSIQAYAGICGTDNIQNNSDPYFHAISFDQISTFLESGGTCHGTIATGNTIPVITAMDNNGVTIPLGTPFTLTASATDGNGDALTYSWEQWDLGGSGAWNSGSSSTTAPLFKSRVPKTSGSRTFPDINVILAGYPTNPSAAMGGLKGETLPQVGRTMKFKLTVRDNRAGGAGITTGGDGCQTGFTSIFQINVAGTGPFRVTSPNGGESYPGASAQTVTWDVAGTNVAPINSANVKITMSTDGGITYPIVVVASTVNDGSEVISVPVVLTTTARMRIEGVGNVYFDISDNNFTITTPISCTSPAVVTQNAVSTSVCATGLTSFTVAGTSTNPVLYQWQSSSNGTTWNNITNNAVYFGTSTATLTINNAPDSLNGFRFRALLSTSACPTQVPTNVSTPAILTVNPKPDVTVTSNVTSLTPGQTATLTASVTSGVTYQWFYNGTAIPGATSGTYVVTVGNLGDYSVQITTPQGCTSQSSSVNIAAKASTQLFIYPVPNNGKFNIAFYHSGSSTKRNVAVYDARGVLVFQSDFTIDMPYKIIPVNIIHAAQGVYIVVIRDKDGKKIATGKALIGIH